MMKERIISYLDEHEEDQFHLLRELVLQSSFSYYKEGIDRVGELVRRQLESCGMEVEVVREKEAGDQLIFRSAPCRREEKSILLVGHMDTVFPVDSPFNWYREDGGKVSGPGIIDMKGGLVVAVFAIRALAHCGLLDTLPVTLICNSDEEIGSPFSSRIIRREAAKCFLAMVFECGGLQGEIVTGRKGKAGYHLEVTGRAGHAAFAGRDKASAILELAHKTIAIEDLNDDAKGIVVNVGVIEGGVGVNSVAETAGVGIDTRYLYQEDAVETAEKIRKIAGESTIPGTSAILRETSSRMPMERSGRNMNLFHLVEEQAEFLGIQVREELRSGVSDANTIAENPVPVIDGMGPVGDCDHSDREYMIKESLPVRTKLAALSLIACREHYLQRKTPS
jgi:glutamate carboxypeptidase